MAVILKTRTRVVTLTMLAALVAIVGCVPSLNAIYTQSDIAFDEDLVGTFKPYEKDQVWAFSKQGEVTYRLVYTDKDGKYGVFDATLAKIGDARFLDLSPVEDPELSQNALWKWHLVPAHTWLLVESTSPSLKLRAMNPNWAKEYLQSHPHELQHVIQNDRLIITASTEEIQKFATLHINTPEAYGDVYTLNKEE